MEVKRFLNYKNLKSFYIDGVYGLIVVYLPNIKLEDKAIVKLLIDRGELTVPAIAKFLGVEASGVDYHLKGLVEKGVVGKKHKSYGSKYFVAENLISISKGATWELSASFVFLLVGGVLLFSNLAFAAGCLLVSSLIGVASIFIE
jgi:hypothetical protein